MKKQDPASITINIHINLTQSPVEEKYDLDEHVWLIDNPGTLNRSPMGL